MRYNVACPDCDAQGKEVPVQVVEGALFCENGHKFQDMEAFQAKRPRSIAGMKPPAPPRMPTNTLEMRFKVNPKFKEALLQRFGSEDKLSSTIPALLGCIMDPAAFFISGEDAEMIARALEGERLKDAKSVTGRILALVTDLKQAKQENENLKKSVASANVASSNGNGTGLMVAFDDLTLMKLGGVARKRGQTEVQVIEDTMYYALENGWV